MSLRLVGFTVLSKGLQPMYVFMLRLPQTTLKITISDELKLVSICNEFTVLCSTFRPGCPLILRGPPLIQKRHQTKFLAPLILKQKKAPKTPSNLFRVEGSQSRDAAEYGPTRHVNQFHYAISRSCFNFGPSIFQVQQNWALEHFLSISATTL